MWVFRVETHARTREIKRSARENLVIIILEKLFYLPTSILFSFHSLHALSVFSRQFVSYISFFPICICFRCVVFDSLMSTAGAAFCSILFSHFQFTFSEWIKIHLLPLHRILSFIRCRYVFSSCSYFLRFGVWVRVRLRASPLWPTWRRDAALMPRKLHFHVCRSSSDNNNEIFRTVVRRCWRRYRLHLVFKFHDSRIVRFRMSFIFLSFFSSLYSSIVCESTAHVSVCSVRVYADSACMMLWEVNIWWLMASHSRASKKALVGVPRIPVVSYLFIETLHKTENCFTFNSSYDLVLSCCHFAFHFFCSTVTSMGCHLPYECPRCIKMSLPIRRYNFGKLLWLEKRMSHSIRHAIETTQQNEIGGHTVAIALNKYKFIWMSFSVFILTGFSSLGCVMCVCACGTETLRVLVAAKRLAAVLCLMKRTPNVCWIKY